MMEVFEKSIMSTDSIPKEILATAISIIIPVKDNQPGIDRFLDTFFKVTPEHNLPKEIIICDNNSATPVSTCKDYPVPVLVCLAKKRGPAAARNAGVQQAAGEWILFTDSDCIPTPTTISGYLSSENSSVAYAGNIEIVTDDVLSNYYRKRKTLIPPEDNNLSSAAPLYLVTANCLVLKSSIEAVGGFNENFKQAGGEDVDLAWRLKARGQLSFALNSITRHEFDDGFNGFVKRFIRYGRGNRQLGFYHAIPMFPEFPKFKKNTLSLHLLAIVEYLAMIYGFMLGEIK